ncbi:MAG: hypothetical protein L0K41_04140 [Yaniella sp.]|uniref:hypothetical protein n=1 Tax=Yaniella sp. TaxID=2773929 RepID=UPI0026477BB7|nr:hypothetical protein [Yaniella sp.]MDN5704334.1 hypothetical protein [Yaniella sp.]MDN5732266.1 hypothetical protein [Yaniella sp.]MDN5742709.1 hypothetical protein [Yaniella sp.]MDN5815754.1 hypothetical protein [Yaniella sp.]MDN5819031.1 hypothetical protein [Yaniella sp.]
MEQIPWFAWIAIVAVIMWGLVMIFGKSSILSNRGDQDDEQRREIDYLKRRVEELEARINRPNL